MSRLKFSLSFIVALSMIAAALTVPVNAVPIAPPNGTVDISWDASAPGGNAAQWQSHAGGNGPRVWNLAAAPNRPSLGATDGNSQKNITAAFSFDGTDVATGASFDGHGGSNSTNDASFEIWTRPGDLGGTNKGILWESGGSGDGSSILLDQSTGEVIYTIKDGNNTTGRRVLTIDIDGSGADGEGVNTNAFVQVTGTYNRDVSGNDRLRLYVNGNNLIGIADTNAINDWSGGDAAGLGSRGGGDIGGDTNNNAGANAGTAEYEPNFGNYVGDIAIMRQFGNEVGGDGIQNNYDALFNVQTANRRANFDADTDIFNDAQWRDNIRTGGARDGNLLGDTARVGGAHGTANDVSKYAHLNYAFSFDGTGDQINTASFDALGSGGDMSAEIWFKPVDLDTGTNEGEVLWETGGTTGASFTIADNILRFGISSANAPAAVTFDMSDIGVDEFIQAIGTYDDSSQLISLFINGELVGTDTGPLTDWSGGNAAAFGGINGNALGGFNNNGPSIGGITYGQFEGQIAKFRLYNRAFSPHDALQNFIAITLIPEPTTLLLGIMGVSALTLRRRRSA